MIGKFFRLSFIGPILGLAFGMLIEAFLHRIHNNYVLEVNVTIVGTYLCWYIAENTAVHVSGILAIVALGVYMSHYGKTGISAESEHALHHVWGYVGFVAETLIFILAGLILGIKIHSMEDTSKTICLDFSEGCDKNDALIVFLNYLILHVIRFGLIFMFWPILNRLGYGMSFKQVLLSSYAGLRGAVGLALALIVQASPKVNPYVKDVILLHVGSIAMWTLLINATTTGKLVKFLKLTEKTEVQKQML